MGNLEIEIQKRISEAIRQARQEGEEYGMKLILDQLKYVPEYCWFVVDPRILHLNPKISQMMHKLGK